MFSDGKAVQTYQPSETHFGQGGVEPEQAAGGTCSLMEEVFKPSETHLGQAGLGPEQTTGETCALIPQ